MKEDTLYNPKFLNIAKLVALLSIIGFIFYKLVYAYNITELSKQFSVEWSGQNILLVCLCFILMPINWWIETFKWKIIFNKHESVTQAQAWKSVLTGVTLSIITPNQIGDIVGKSLYLKHYSKIKGAIATITGGISQTIASLVAGSFGALALLNHKLQFESQFLYLGFFGAVAVSCLSVYIFMNIHYLNKLIKHPKISEYVSAFTHFTKHELLSLLLLSSVRLAVFSAQYYLLLLFFGVDITITEAAMSISVIFLTQAFLPSFVLIEIGVRGAVALFFIGIFSANSIGILSAAYTLWILNMMLPALVGLYFFLTLKWRS